MKQKFNWAKNLDVNFVHFWHAHHQKLEQYSGEKSVAVFLIYSYTLLKASSLGRSWRMDSREDRLQIDPAELLHLFFFL